MVVAGLVSCSPCPSFVLPRRGLERPFSQRASGSRIHGNATWILGLAVGKDFCHGGLPFACTGRPRSRFLSRTVVIRARNVGRGSSADDGSQRQEASNVGGSREKYNRGLKSAFRIGASRYYEEFVEEVTGALGVEPAAVKAGFLSKYRFVKGFMEITSDKAKEQIQVLLKEARRLKEKGGKEFNEARARYWPLFVAYNRWDMWKNVKNWDGRRVGTLVLYVLLATVSLAGMYSGVTRPRASKGMIKTLANEYMEAVIPAPTTKNIQKVKRGVFREEAPDGLEVHKYMLGKDGEYHRDPSYVGENAWEEPDEELLDLDKIIDEDDSGMTDEQKAELKKIGARGKARRLAEEQRKREEFIAIYGEEAVSTPESQKQEEERWSKSTWQQRLDEWKKIFAQEQLEELTDETSRYQVQASMPEVRQNYLADQSFRASLPPQLRASFWVARRWWKYRPKLPYTYFLSQVETLQVASAVFSTDMRKLYVTMKEGFPSEFVVDVPVDPFLYPKLKNCGVEIDILSRSNFSFFFRALVATLPGVLIILYIRAIQYRAKEKMSEEIYDLLTMNRRQLILPEVAADKAKSQYKDVVVGGDVWVVLDEIMTYMRDPLKYHSRGVKLPRGILISGPPGTGKTLLARAIARECGLPFVFASGAEFVESSSGNGSDKVFDIFFTARANAPSFVFIDEIDALAGKNAKDDAERRATFQQLLAELDGEPDDTDVDRFSLRQAVILIAATNRPDELDEQLTVPGRIDREITIGLPGEAERLQIFEVHSEGKRLAKDVDFSKMVYRTIGYSGADIRNFINEAGIMAVRKGRTEITQTDFLEVLDKQLFEGMGMVLTDDEQQRIVSQVPEGTKRLLAVHEAGHILLAHLFPRFDWHAFSNLLPGGKDTALTVFFPREEMLQLGYTTVGYLKMQMVVAHGGRCAERLINGDDITDGGQDDLVNISRIAREIAITHASPRLGLFPKQWQGHLDPQERPGEVALIPNEWSKPGSLITNMTVEFSELFTREVRRYIDETEDQAMEALRKNRRILERLVDELVVKSKLSGIEAEEIIKSMDPIMMEDPMYFPPIKFDQEMPAMPPNMKGRYEYLDIYPAPLHRC